MQRGKVTINIETEATGAATAKSLINSERLSILYKELKAIAIQRGVSYDNLLPALIARPEMIQPQTEGNPNSVDEWPEIEKALNEALIKFETFRKAEGEALHVELVSYINNIGKAGKNCFTERYPYRKDKIRYQGQTKPDYRRRQD